MKVFKLRWWVLSLPFILTAFALAGYFLGQQPQKPPQLGGAFVFGIAQLEPGDSPFLMLLERELQMPINPVNLHSKEDFLDKIDDLDFWLVPNSWQEDSDKQYSFLHLLPRHYFEGTQIKPHHDFFQYGATQSQFLDHVPYFWNVTNGKIEVFGWSFHRERVPRSIVDLVLTYCFNPQVAVPWARSRSQGLTFLSEENPIPKDVSPEKLRLESFLSPEKKAMNSSEGSEAQKEKVRSIR